MRKMSAIGLTTARGLVITEQSKKGSNLDAICWFTWGSKLKR